MRQFVLIEVALICFVFLFEGALIVNKIQNLFEIHAETFSEAIHYHNYNIEVIK